MDYQVITQEKINNLLNPVNIVLIIVELSFLMIIGFIFASVINDDDVNFGVVVENTRSIDEIPSGVRDSVSVALYNIVSLNTEDGQNVNVSGAFVRDGTMVRRHFDNNDESEPGFETVSFVVDIPSLEQSYWVQYEKSDEYDEEDSENDWTVVPTVTCLLDSEKKFNNFVCNSQLGEFERNRIAANYLGYASFEDFYAYIDEGDLSRIKIVSRFYEHSPEQDAKYVEEVKEFVESLGIPVELFEYYIVPVDEIEIL